MIIYDKEGFVHAKTITVDGRIASVGTANMDMRSYELNYEINAIIYDEEKSLELESMFCDDLNRSTEMTIEYYEGLPRTVKFIDALARTFSSLL